MVVGPWSCTGPDLATSPITNTCEASASTTITVTTGLADTLFAEVEIYNLSANADNVTVVTGNEDVNLGDGANNMTSTSTTADVDGGANVDTFTLNGASNGTYNTFAGADTVSVNGGGPALVVPAGTSPDMVRPPAPPRC